MSIRFPLTMSLLPTNPTERTGERQPQVIGLRDDSEVFSVLTSEIARDIVAELYEEQAVASELAACVGTSLQNTKYHLENLLEAGVVEVVDTCYSPKGREMNVYAPAANPLTVILGDSGSMKSCRDALTDNETT